MSLRELFGKKLSEVRKKQGLTQTELAEMISMQTHSIAQIETGKRAPSFDTLEKLSTVLNIDYSELFEFENFKSKSIYTNKILKTVEKLDNVSLEFILSNLENFKKYLNTTQKDCTL